MAIYLRYRENKIEVINPETGTINVISQEKLKELEQTDPSRLFWL